MRLSFLTLSVSAALVLGACDAWETATPPPVPPPAPIAETAPPSFEDNSCLGYLLLQRAAVVEGRAQGEVAALGTAITAWRARGAAALSADELAQYETSSVAVLDDESSSVIGERAQACVTSAPPTPAPATTPAPSTPQSTPPG
jgi:hypothetical protein